MSARWARTPPTRREELTAAAVAGALGVCVGLAAFYVARLLLARERIDVPDARALEAGGAGARLPPPPHPG